MQRKTYRFAVWKRWDHELHAAVEDFQARTNYYPNVLLANPTTFAKVNLAASRSNIGKGNGEVPEDCEYLDLTGFVGLGYELRFAETPKLQDREFALLYDTDPDGGGEPWPDEDTVTGSNKVRRSA